MKTIITSALILVIMFAVAQNDGTRATDVRLVGYHSENYTGGTWQGTDSSKYIYNNPNAGMGEYMFMYDSAYTYLFNTGIWNNSYRYVYAFNTAGSVMQYDTHEHDGSMYNQSYRTVYTRNANNKLTELSVYTWSGYIVDKRKKRAKYIRYQRQPIIKVRPGVCSRGLAKR